MEGSAIRKGRWTSEEDKRLFQCIMAYGPENWSKVPQRAGLNRNGKSCRERWSNYLRPDIKRGNISVEEELEIIRLHSIHGNCWSKIASQLEGRTDNEIKNYYKKRLSKRWLHQGDDKNNIAPNQNYRPMAQPMTGGSCSTQQYSTRTNFTNVMTSSSSLPVASAGSGRPQELASSSAAADDENYDDWLEELLANDDEVTWTSLGII